MRHDKEREAEAKELASAQSMIKLLGTSLTEGQQARLRRVFELHDFLSEAEADAIVRRLTRAREPSRGSGRRR